MLTDVQKKVLLDVFGSSWVLLPIFGGLSAFILGWASSPGWFSSMCNLGGFISLLTGLGIFGTRCVLNGDKFLTNQKQYEHEDKLRKLQRQLNDLDQRLTTDRDARTQRCLREITSLYETIQLDVMEGKIPSYNYRMLETIEKLFNACVAQLEQTYILYNAGRSLDGTAKKKIKTEREKLVLEVLEAQELLKEAVQQFHLNRSSQNRKEVNKLTEQLDLQLEAVRSIDNNLETEFDNFIEQPTEAS